MSTIVCQNLVSCIESQLTDTNPTTTTLKLKLAESTPSAAMDLCRKLEADDLSPRNEFGYWAFLQTNSKESGDKDCIYTHPLTKYSSSSKLSPKSLELCTENLGSESGYDNISECGSIFSASPPLSPTSNSGEDHKGVLDDWKQKRTNAHSREEGCRKINNFPPPLTTMRPLQVRRHQEGGRLIIEAVEGPFRNSYLHAERTHGRLKLSFTTATSQQEEEIGEPRNEFQSEMEELDGGEINVIEKFQRLSRCKEGGHGNKGLCSSWKPALWVATS